MAKKKEYKSNNAMDMVLNSLMPGVDKIENGDIESEKKEPKKTSNEKTNLKKEKRDKRDKRFSLLTTEATLNKLKMIQRGKKVKSMNDLINSILESYIKDNEDLVKKIEAFESEIKQ